MKIFGLKVPFTKDSTGVVEKSWVSTTFTGDWYKPNWFQMGDTLSKNTAMQSSTVYACVATLAQEVARLRINHYRNPALSGRNEVINSTAAKVLLKPNHYQTRSDLFLSIMHSLLLSGNSYCLAIRDNRNAVVALYPLNPNAVQVYVEPDSGAIFYSLSQLDIDPARIDPSKMVPKRNMLHIKLFTPTHPLIGETPLSSCSASVAHGLSIQEESTNFFQNQSKPSGILRTPKPLSPETAKRIREAWSQGTSGTNAGKVPVLDNDLQFQQMSISATDSQLIEQYAMSKKDIAIVYRIPLYMIGEGENTFKSAEAAQRDFITRTLGFYLEHIEADLDSFFGFDGRTEYVEFDVERGIMRPEMKERIDALTKAVQGAVYTPNEARRVENLPPVDGGDNALAQRQNVPINLLGLDVLSMDDGAGSEDDNSDEDKSFIVNLTKEKMMRLH